MTNGLLEIGQIVLASAERRLEIVSRNIANGSTAGFKAQTSFDDVLQKASQPDSAGVSRQPTVDFAQGAMRVTGRSLDLAISGEGFFQVRAADGEQYYTRNGEFELGPTGMLLNAQGMALQSASGDDILVSASDIEILPDGVVLEDGLAVGQVGVFNAGDDNPLNDIGAALFASDAPLIAANHATLRQGMVENANVRMADEMVAMMQALRSAEIGSKIVQTYDALIDKSISTFGKAS